jgi:hypothetical protein
MTPYQKKRILLLLMPLLILLAAEKVHHGAGKAILTVGTLSLVTYCFVNSDKAWARRILDSPKKWWQ